MSTLKVTNIQATGETASRAVSGVAAAWVSWNGTGTISIKDSENTSSLVDLGTGIAEINLTSGYNAIQYTGSAFAASSLISNGSYEAMFYGKSTTTYFQRNHWQTTYYDLAHAGSNSFGELA